MQTLPKRGLLTALRSSAPLGIFMGAILLLWEWIGKLMEHVVLTWIADHLAAVPFLLDAASWTLGHRIQAFITFGFIYCLFVIGRALWLPQEPLPKNAAAVLSPTPRNQPSQRPSPYFEFIGLGTTPLYVSNSPAEGFRPPVTPDQAEASLRAITLRFTNLAKPDGSSGRAWNVIARLRLYSDDWTRYMDIDYAVWIGSPAEVTDMDVGDVREAVLFIRDDDNTLVALRDLRHTGRFEFGQAYARPEPADWARNVEVILIDQRSHASRSWVFHIKPDGLGFIQHDIIPPPQASRLPK